MNKDMAKAAVQKKRIVLVAISLGFASSLLVAGFFVDAMTPSRVEMHNSNSAMQRKVAIMLVGDERIQATQVWETIVKHVIVPIREYYGHKSVNVDVFSCAGHEHLIFERIAADSSVTASFYWIFNSSDQFDRMGQCYERIQNFHRVAYYYDHVIRTRPDLAWFNSISLPFSDEHIMTRVRVAMGGEDLTRAHLSYESCQSEFCYGDTNDTAALADAGHDFCGVLDDQLAIVPLLHQDVYFLNRTRSPAAAATAAARKIGKDHSGGKPGKGEVRPLMEISEWPTCPCIKDLLQWPEWRLTARLAEAGPVMVTPFQTALTFKEQRENVGYRFIPQDQQENVTTYFMKAADCY